MSDEPNVLYSGKYLNLVERNGWEYVTRNHHDVVIILPVLDDGKLVLISEFRKPLMKRVIGLPAGLVGDNDGDEGIFDAARRELVEEIGYQANQLELVMDNSPSSSGMTDEIFNLFIARKLIRVSEGGGDESEDIRVIFVDPQDLPKLTEEWKKQGHVIDPKLFMGLYFAQNAG